MHIHNELYLILHMGLCHRILFGRCEVGKIQFKFFSCFYIYEELKNVYSSDTCCNSIVNLKISLFACFMDLLTDFKMINSSIRIIFISMSNALYSFVDMSAEKILDLMQTSINTSQT